MAEGDETVAEMVHFAADGSESHAAAGEWMEIGEAETLGKEPLGCKSNVAALDSLEGWQEVEANVDSQHLLGVMDSVLVDATERPEALHLLVSPASLSWQLFLLQISRSIDSHLHFSLYVKFERDRMMQKAKITNQQWVE